jgi:hypothetical protein
VKENSIEEDIKNAEHFIKSIKTDKEYKEDGWHGYYNKEIVELARILQHILSDYKRVLKENEELLEVKVSASAHNRILELQKENEELKEIYRSEKKMKNKYIKLYQDLLLKENVIPTQNIKDRIEELNRKIDKSIDNSKGGLDEEFIEKAGELLTQKRILQELLEGRK